MNDLMRINTTTLLNKELAKSVNEINKAVIEGNKSSWRVAEELTRIVEDELFEEDFDTEKQFAEFVGLSKSYFSQCKSAVRFKEQYGLDTTVNKAYLFSTLEDYNEFADWVLTEYGAQPTEFADKAIKDLIKEFKNKDVEPVEETEEEPAEDIIDEVEEVNNIMIEVVDNEGIRYIVPLSVLNQYRVEG